MSSLIINDDLQQHQAEVADYFDKLMLLAGDDLAVARAIATGEIPASAGISKETPAHPQAAPQSGLGGSHNFSRNLEKTPDKTISLGAAILCSDTNHNVH